MKLRTGIFLSIMTAASVLAQPPEGFGGRGPGGRGGVARFNPIFQALDSDEDGELSGSEIKNAAKSLRKLDKNKDGELTMDELRPNVRREGGPGSPPPQASDPEAMIKNLMAFDKNGDGKLSRDELPERMQAMLERGDLNKDGFLTPDEIRSMAQAQPGPGSPDVGGGPGGGRRVDPLFAALDTDHNGVLSKEEIDAAPESLKKLDKNGDGKITMDEIRPQFGPGGPPRNRERQQ